MSEAETGGAWSEPRQDQSTTGGGASPKEMAQSAAQTIKQETASFAGEAKDRAAEKLEQHKQTASQTLGDFANAVRKAGDELSQGDQSMAGRVVRQAADGLESFARSVADKRPEELIDAVRDFGRRNPTAFIAGSVLVGVALGRFLKSSGHAETAPERRHLSAGAGELPLGSTRVEPADLGGGLPVTAADGDLAVLGADPELGPELDREGSGDGTDVDRARFTPGS
jgi:hypothetical protein